jgi:hypothetical protein
MSATTPVVMLAGLEPSSGALPDDRAQRGDDGGRAGIDVLDACAGEHGGGGFQELVGEIGDAARLEHGLHVEQDFGHRMGEHFAGGLRLAVAIGIAGGQDMGFGDRERDIVDNRIRQGRFDGHPAFALAGGGGRVHFIQFRFDIGFARRIGGRLFAGAGSSLAAGSPHPASAVVVMRAAPRPRCVQRLILMSMAVRGSFGIRETGLRLSCPK